MIRLSLVILLVVLPWPANAQEEGRWVRQAMRSSCDWWENCPRYRRVWVPGPRYYELRARRDIDSSRHLDRCKPALRVWGAQAQTVENARGKALEALAGATRFQYGEIYLDFSLAEDVKLLCGPSSVSDTLTSKFQEKVLNTEYFRCEVQARPCRPQRKED